MLHTATFKPAGHRQPVAAVTRRLLPEIVAALHKQLARDWTDSNFAVLATEDDMLAVRFELQSLDSARAVLAYMNTLARAPDGFCARYSLHCESTDWNRAPGDGYLYYMWKPSWVRPVTSATAAYVERSGISLDGSSSSADDKTLKASSTFSRFSSSSAGAAAAGAHGDSSLAGFDSLTSIGSAVAAAQT
jgi:hypothetical protein